MATMRSAIYGVRCLRVLPVQHDIFSFELTLVACSGPQEAPNSPAGEVQAPFSMGGGEMGAAGMHTGGPSGSMHSMGGDMGAPMDFQAFPSADYSQGGMFSGDMGGDMQAMASVDEDDGDDQPFLEGV